MPTTPGDHPEITTATTQTAAAPAARTASPPGRPVGRHIADRNVTGRQLAVHPPDTCAVPSPDTRAGVDQGGPRRMT
jgi:hypothetical protein